MIFLVVKEKRRVTDAGAGFPKNRLFFNEVKNYNDTVHAK